MLTFNHQQKLDRLNRAVLSAETDYALAVQRAYRSGTKPPVRHKTFITYHGDDIDAVTKFVEDFNDVFIPRVVGASDSDHFQDPIDSKKVDYIMRQIREKYLTDSTVTILFAGKCAWARKFVDWEIASSLRNDPSNKRNGLMAITPSSRAVHTLPGRFSDNYDSNSQATSYGRYYYYPTSKDDLRQNIQDAFDARVTRAHLVANSRALRTNNSSCE